MAPGDDLDSGMESQNDGSPDKTQDLSLFDDEPDETLSERLWGLTEMFPESVRNTTFAITNTTSCAIKGLYGVSRSLLWIFFSSSVIIFSPVLFEVERAQLEDMQRNQQKQVLLGPTSGSGMPLLPPVPR